MSASRSGRLGNPKVTGSNLDLTFSNPDQVKAMTLKLILVSPQPDTQHYYDRATTGLLSVRIMRLSGLADHRPSNWLVP